MESVSSKWDNFGLAMQANYSEGSMRGRCGALKNLFRLSSFVSVVPASEPVYS